MVLSRERLAHCALGAVEESPLQGS
jgi:hypothetical protein